MTTRTKTWTPYIVSASLCVGSLAGLITGCGSSDSEEEVCSKCDAIGYATYNCYKANNDKYRGSLCLPDNSSEQEVAFECTSEYGWLTPLYGVAAPCDGSDETAGAAAMCAAWAPATEVTVSTAGVYEVDQSFLDGLVSDSAPLVVCDDARMEPQPTGGYLVVDATSGTLLYELGLRNGDVPLTLNGKPLSDFIDASQALGDLYLNQGTMNYTLVLARGSSTISLQYTVNP